MKRKWLFIGSDCIRKEYFNTIQNIPYFNKPFGGLWSSPYCKNSKYKSQWHEFINEDMITKRSNQAVIFSLNNNARILKIDTLKDLEEVIEKYSSEYELLGKTLDYEKLSKDYDAIHLTNRGQKETRFSRPSLYGWDVESLFIMNFDIINKQKKITIK